MKKLVLLTLVLLTPFMLSSCSSSSVSTNQGTVIVPTHTETISVTGISLDVSSLELTIGDTYRLIATLTPSNASDKTITWKSSDESVASIDNGLLTALKVGSASITATAGSYNATCEVEVKDNTPSVVNVTGISVDEEIFLLKGNNAQLHYYISPSNATNKNVSWKSSNNSIASVSDVGLVSAHEVGQAYISVISENGGYTASCLVNVTTDEVSVEGVSLNYETLSIYEDTTVVLTATIVPYNATNKNVTWDSSDTSVASVDQSGIVEALNKGETTISVITEDGGYLASCLLTVLEKENPGPYIPDDDVYTITEAGEYDLKGSYKQIYVNAPEGEVILNLKGVEITSEENSPIYVASCGSIDISAKSGTTNYINDNRSTYNEDVDGQGKGAIYVEDGDLTLKGQGELTINASYLNGIHGKDDVKIKNLTLNINAINHAIRGNDSVTITSGTLTLSCGGDALHSDNSDVSTSGKQRGNINVNGGTLTINSRGDAIDASYNAVIEQLDDTIPLTMDIRTNKYSSYSGETIDTSSSSFYLKMSSSTYSNGNYTYAAYINNAWYRATYKGTISNGGAGGPGGPGGGGNTYHVYQIEKPSGATSFTLYRYSGSNVTSFSTTSYNAYSDTKAFNSAYDMVSISVSSGRINFGNWSNYSSGNSNSASISAKGIKAMNEVYVKSGALTFKTYDDAIHANKDGVLENGSTALGNVHIEGGHTSIYASDDGVHADNILYIAGGYLEVTSSYEGLEANSIRISGGESYIAATDDGLNACKGSSTPNITVSGGYLDVGVPGSGDTDGIDSNGTYTQTGGVVIVKGPGSASNENFGAAAVDTDGSVTLSNCTIIVFGGFEKTPSTSLTKTLCSSSTVTSGTHTVSFASASYTTKLTSNTRGCVVYSNLGSASLN